MYSPESWSAVLSSPWHIDWLTDEDPMLKIGISRGIADSVRQDAAQKFPTLLGSLWDESTTTSPTGFSWRMVVLRSTALATTALFANIEDMTIYSTVELGAKMLGFDLLQNVTKIRNFRENLFLRHYFSLHTLCIIYPSPPHSEPLFSGQQFTSDRLV